jgi:hypothetical protein
LYDLSKINIFRESPPVKTQQAGKMQTNGTCFSVIDFDSNVVLQDSFTVLMSFAQ